MKKSLQLTTMALLLAWGTIFPGNVNACNNSSFTLTGYSVVGSGATAVYTITTQLCIGYGRTGTTFGADGPTGVFFGFSVFGPATPDLNSAFTSVTTPISSPPLPDDYLGAPDSYALSDCGCPSPGYGANYFGLGEQDAIIFDDWGVGADNFACINSTIQCGNAGSWCNTMTFVYTGARPDSIRAVGIEGLAPFGGCWPNPDMVISLTSLPVVWGEFGGVPSSGGVNLNWNTYQETNTKNFVVTRANPGDNAFTEIGTVIASGTSIDLKNYQFFDPNPVPGINTYQLIQVDQSGRTEKSSVVTVNYSAPIGVSFATLYPNPAVSDLQAIITSEIEGAAKIHLINVSGQVVNSYNTSLLVGANEVKLDVSALAPGVYFLRLQTNEGMVEKKFLKQ